MVGYCAGTTVNFIDALIVEEEGYVFTREEKTVVPSANQGGKAREAELRSVASRAERGEEGLRLPRLLLAGTSMEKLLCRHNCIQYFCKQFPGGGICAHNNNRYYCKICRDHR